MITPYPLVSSHNPAVKVKAEVFGVPFDSTSTYRNGSRFGPEAIREAFMNIEVYSKKHNLDLEDISLEDLGDLEKTANTDIMVRNTKTIVKRILKEKRVPIVLGGEHTITYAAFEPMPENTALVVLDAHLDMRDEYDDSKLMHATFLRRIIEKRKGLKVIHIGTRAAVKDEWYFAKKNNVKIVSSEDILNGNHHIEELTAYLEQVSSVYISIDLDALDPAYAPGVSNPETMGITPSQAMNYVRLLENKSIKGVDVLELCPQYDPSGITAVAAARFMAEICYFIYSNP